MKTIIRDKNKAFIEKLWPNWVWILGLSSMIRWIGKTLALNQPLPKMKPIYDELSKRICSGIMNEKEHSM